MKITFNVGEACAEVYNLSLLKTTLLVASLYGGIAFWIMAAVMLFDSSYR